MMFADRTFVRRRNDGIVQRRLMNQRQSTLTIIMAALWNKAGYYIFALWFLSFYLFFLANLSRRRLDVYHTSTHDVALVRI